MEDEELNKIIEILESKNSKDIASFGLYYQDGEDEMHLKANKDGFGLFAAELLKASRDSKNIMKDSGKDYISFEYKEWIGGELIAYIKPITENRNEIQEDKPIVDSYKDYALKYGCYTIIGIILLAIIIGIYTIVNWFL